LKPVGRSLFKAKPDTRPTDAQSIGNGVESTIQGGPEKLGPRSWGGSDPIRISEERAVLLLDRHTGIYDYVRQTSGCVITSVIVPMGRERGTGEIVVEVEDVCPVVIP
jgi:hypothetical protein